MCLLTYLPEGVQPDTAKLLTGARSNSDGHGFAIVVPDLITGKGRILVRKSMKATSLINEFEQLRALYSEGPALFHSRITTDGETGLFNCHPFMHRGDKRTVIGHNGILPGSVRPGKGDVRSDTRIFAEEVAGHFKLHTVIGRQLAGEWMGDYNKVVVLTVDPIYDQYGYIINESSGEWNQGIWYSNSSYKGYGYRSVTSGNYTYYGTDGGEDDAFYVSASNSRVWKDWKWCGNMECSSKYTTVNPYTLLCSKCGLCDLCCAKPCECDLEVATSGKGLPPKALSAAESATVIGGSPAKGATVVRATTADDYAVSVQEYRQALEVAARASQGAQEPDPEDDPADVRAPQLQEVLALVDHLNKGGELDDWEPGTPARDALDVWMASNGITPENMAPLAFGDRDDDQDALINVLFGEDVPPSDVKETVVIDGVVFEVEDPPELVDRSGVKYALH